MRCGRCRHFEASEDRYRRLATHAADVVFRLSQAGEMVWISDAVTLLLGWRPDELTDRPFIEFVHPEDRDRFRSPGLGLGEPSNLEFRVRTAEGGYKVGGRRGSAGVRRSGPPDRPIRRLATSTPRCRRAKPCDAARRCSAPPWEHSAVGMALVAPDGAFMEANRALCQMLGRGRRI